MTLVVVLFQFFDVVHPVKHVADLFSTYHVFKGNWPDYLSQILNDLKFADF